MKYRSGPVPEYLYYEDLSAQVSIKRGFEKNKGLRRSGSVPGYLRFGVVLHIQYSQYT